MYISSWNRIYFAKIDIFRHIFTTACRGLLAIFKNLLLLFFPQALSKIAHILTLTASIFIKLSFFASLSQALSTMSHKWLNDSWVISKGSQNDSDSTIFASSGLPSTKLFGVIFSSPLSFYHLQAVVLSAFALVRPFFSWT